MSPAPQLSMEHAGGARSSVWGKKRTSAPAIRMSALPDKPAWSGLSAYVRETLKPQSRRPQEVSATGGSSRARVSSCLFAKLIGELT
jgi:hypothetical protein